MRIYIARCRSLVDSDLLQRRLVKVLPHIIDTVFLLSGIGLILVLHLNVLQQGWLLTKIAALVLYIVLGMLALRRPCTAGTPLGRVRRRR